MIRRIRQVAPAVLALVVASVSFAQPVDVLKPATSVVIERDGQKTPFPTAKAAVEAARKGDVIVLGPGSHAGPLVMTNSNVTLTGEPGARVNANSDVWKPAWTKEPACGPFAHSSPIDFQPVTMAIDQRVMIDAQERRGGLAVHKEGAGRNGRAALGAVFTYVAKEKKVVVSFATDLNPAEHVIEATPEDSSAILIKNADHVTVKNLILTGGEAGVQFLHSNESVVQQCLIYGCDAGVRFSQGANGCRAIGNDITWNEDSLHADCSNTTADVGNDVWHAHKKYGTYDKFGVAIDRSGQNNEIGGNYIYNVWNGITTDDGVPKDKIEEHYKNKVFKGIVEYNQGLKVHHNRLDLTMDDALEPGSDLVDNEWHSNLVTRARCATRFKTITQGPFFYYNNTLLDSSDGIRLYKSMPESANVYIFNNVEKFSTGVVYHDMDSVAWDNPWLRENLPKGTPGFMIFNNVFVCKQAFANNMSDGNKPVKPNFKGDFNLYTSGSDPMVMEQGIDAHSLFQAEPKFVDADHGDYRLAVGSPGKGAGKTLGELEIKGKLPEVLAKDHPNIGLFDDDTATPHGPVTPLWALAERQLNLGERDITQYSIAPLRWVAGPAFDFVVLPDAGQQQVELNFIRSDASGKSKFKVAITDDKGQPLSSRDGKPADKDGFSETISLNGVASLKVHIEDSKDGQWRLDAGNAKVGLSTAGPLPLRKFDGVGYVLTYAVPKDTASFDVSFKSKYSGTAIDIVRPDGQTDKPIDGTVQTNGVAGEYKIVVRFTKAADLTVTGPGGAVMFEPSPEKIALKPIWGKPVF